jgi:tetratricopeptide (TPR) repeat protein
MRRRGATEHATEVLRLLCSVAERRDLPSTSYACFNFGELLFEKSDLEQAQIFFDKVIKKNKPENVVAAAYARSAAIFNLKADPEKAIFAAERAVEIYRRLDKPESLAHTYLQLARALSAAGKSQRAVEALDQAMKLPIRLESLLLPPRGWMEQSETLKKDMSRNSFHVDPAVS